MMPFIYSLKLEDGTMIIIESDCASNEFDYAVQFVRDVSYGLAFNTNHLLEILKVLGFKAEYFEAEITKSYTI